MCFGHPRALLLAEFTLSHKSYVEVILHVYHDFSQSHHFKYQIHWMLVPGPDTVAVGHGSGDKNVF